MNLIFKIIKEYLFLLISTVQGFLTGIALAQFLQRAGLLNIGKFMQNFVAFCVVVFLVMLVYVLYVVLFDSLSKKNRLYIGLALLIFAFAADAYYIPV